MIKSTNPSQEKFSLGQIVATPAAISLLNQCHETQLKYLMLHATGYWGNICDEDKRQNDNAIAHEGDLEQMGRVLSSYKLPNGKTLWVITEADRSSTCLLLPEEY